MSALPESAVRPPGPNATEVTLFVCPASVRSSRPAATSQSLRVLSSLPERAVRPSGLKATEVTLPLCPDRMCSSRFLATSQSLRVRPWLPERAMRPSGLKTTRKPLVGIQASAARVPRARAVRVWWQCHRAGGRIQSFRPTGGAAVRTEGDRANAATVPLRAFSRDRWQRPRA